MQLRQENLRADSYNLVGFQNHLKFGDQARVLRLIPGLENARFCATGRFTATHTSMLQRYCANAADETASTIFFAGQICGVEGYVESIATGLLAGMHAAALSRVGMIAPPRASAFGSLTHYITQC